MICLPNNHIPLHRCYRKLLQGLINTVLPWACRERGRLEQLKYYLALVPMGWTHLVPAPWKTSSTNSHSRKLIVLTLIHKTVGIIHLSTSSWTSVLMVVSGGWEAQDAYISTKCARDVNTPAMAVTLSVGKALNRPWKINEISLSLSFLSSKLLQNGFPAGSCWEWKLHMLST